MSIVAIMTIPGMTEAQYRTVREMLGEDLQPGNLVHVAGPIDGGWQVVEVWESPDAMGAFFQSPAAGQAFQAAGVPPVQPVVTAVDTLAAAAHPSA
jgi:quinol monooxygenase YgiN